MRATSWLLAAGMVLAGAVGLTPNAWAAVDRPFPLVTVTGEASMTVKPDIAYTNAGVATEAKTPREAAEANARIMTAVIAALKQAGIAETDIGTTRFAIAPIYAPRERSEQRVTGFRVSNQVRAAVRDISKVGEVLDKLVAAGATDISGVNFTVSNASKLLDQARAAAVADARRKAELLAQAAGAQVGRAVNIAEDDAQPPRPYMQRAAAMAAPASTPMEPGEETLRVSVTVSFELNN
jgi:uncharacterized protein YggE